jgi:LysM repeat protein
MKKRSFILLVLLTFTLLVMTGCTRSATRAPRATATPEGGIPFPDPTQSQIMVDILAGTQTAQAQESLAAETTQAPATGGVEPAGAATTAPTAEPVAMAFPTATPGVPATYTIQPDEFPFCIARRFNLNAGELLAINGLDMESFVVPGFVLTLPQNSTYYGERALKPHPTDYTVQAGDTIGKIACGFGDVNPYDIYAVNSLSQGAALTTGQVLHIP